MITLPRGAKLLRALPVLGIFSLVLAVSGCSGLPSEEIVVAPNEDDFATGGSSPEEENHSAVEGSAFLGEYEVLDSTFGTETRVRFENGYRTIVSNALPDHETGAFPNGDNPNAISPQDKVWSFPLDPVFTGQPQPAYEIGVAINGVKFEPGTDEKVICSSGEVYPVEGLQDVVNLGMDLNNAHVQPSGEYHYHGISDLMVELLSSEADLVHVGFARDGHLIYYSKSSQYSSSFRLGSGIRDGSECFYTPGKPGSQPVEFGSAKDGSLTDDWEYFSSYGDLDECNGSIVEGSYKYFVTDTFPFFPRCLMGEFEAEIRGPAAGQQPPPEGDQGPSPDKKGPPPPE